MWLLSPSGWPTFTDDEDTQADLLARGYEEITEAEVPAAVAAFQAAENSPPSTQLPGYALAADVATALAAKANASALAGKLSITDIANPASAGGLALRAAFGARPVGWNHFSLSNQMGPRGVLCAQDRPAVYDAVSNKSFVALLGVNRALWAVSFDHATRRFSRERRIASYPNDINDDHGTPSMAVTADGRINIIFGAHNGAPRTARSNVARDVEGGWTVATPPGALNGTYHSLASIGNDVYCLLRAGGGTHTGSGSAAATFPSHEFGVIAKSSDGMATWTAATVVDLNAYSAPGVDATKDFYLGAFDATADGRLAFSFCVAHGAAHDGARSDIHHAYYDPADGTLQTVSGADLGTAIDTRAKFDACRVHAVAEANVPRQAFGPGGKVMLTWVEQNTADSKIATMAAYSAGGAWTVTDLGARTRHIQSQPAVRWDDDTDQFEVFAPVGRATETTILKSLNEPMTYAGIGCDIKLFTSADGATFTDNGIVVDSRDVFGVGVNGISVPRDAAPELKALVVPGSIGNPNTFNGELPSFGLPLYGLTDQVRDFTLTARNPRGRAEQRFQSINVKPFATGAPFVPAADTWQTIDLSAFIPPNTTEVLLWLTGHGTGTAGRWEMRVRMFNSVRSYDGQANGRGEWGTGQSTATATPVWVPVNEGKVEWRYNGQLGNWQIAMTAIRTEGSVCPVG